MYVFDRTIGLVTIPSDFKGNLSLLEVDDVILADSIAVARYNFINYVPLLSSDTRRCKYVPVNINASTCMDGSDRKLSENITKIQWLKIDRANIFVALTKSGMQIFDAELMQTIFTYNFVNENGENCTTIGVYVLNGSFLCVSTLNGSVFVFESNGGKFQLVSCNILFDSKTKLCHGINDYLVSYQEDKIFYLAEMRGDYFTVKSEQEKLCPSEPNILKVLNFLIVVGYKNGHLSFFDNQTLKPLGECFPAHKSAINDVDYSEIKCYFLTVCQKGELKVWQFDELNFSVTCLYSYKNPANAAYLGCGFLNMTAMELCAVAAKDINVHLFVNGHLDDNATSH